MYPIWTVGLGLVLWTAFPEVNSAAQAAALQVSPSQPRSQLLPSFVGSDITQFVPGALSAYLQHQPTDQGSAFFTADSITTAELETVAGIQTFRWIARIPLMVLRVDLFEHYRTSPLTLVECSPYGGAILYAVVDAEDKPQGYLSLVDLQGTTLVMLWERDPHSL